MSNFPLDIFSTSFCNANVKKTTEGLHIPADGGKPQIVTGRTKMLDAFHNMVTFSSAWMIYVSIRSSYDLERGPALSYWMERLVHYYQGFNGLLASITL